MGKFRDSSFFRDSWRFFGVIFTLFLTDRKERAEAKVRFKNRLTSLAYELKANFRYVGNYENPFQTKALENLVCNEPLIHESLQLFEKAQKCLTTATILSTSKHPQKNPSDGQFLMKDLSEYLRLEYKINVPDL